MDVREKYVMQKVNRKEKSICPNCIHHNLCIAENNQPCFECNRFIDAHGVTVQEWISVKDRLPEPKELVLCIWKDINGIHYGFARYQHDNVWYVSNEGMPEVTHWMALPKKPQPPKGE